MPLTLHPDIDRISRMDLETHIRLVQLRRLSAAMTYYQGQNAKLQSTVDKVDRRLVAKYETLGKRLTSLDKSLALVEKLASEIEELKNTRSQANDLMVIMDTERDDDAE